MVILYAFPAFLYIGFMVIVGLGSVAPVAWLYAVLLAAAAVLLSRSRWWGSLPGMAAGALLAFQNSVGIALVVYYAILGIVCFRRKK